MLKVAKESRTRVSTICVLNPKMLLQHFNLGVESFHKFVDGKLIEKVANKSLLMDKTLFGIKEKLLSAKF